MNSLTDLNSVDLAIKLQIKENGPLMFTCARRHISHGIAYLVFSMKKLFFSMRALFSYAI